MQTTEFFVWIGGSAVAPGVTDTCDEAVCGGGSCVIGVNGCGSDFRAANEGGDIDKEFIEDGETSRPKISSSD